MSIVKSVSVSQLKAQVHWSCPISIYPHHLTLTQMIGKLRTNVKKVQRQTNVSWILNAWGLPTVSGSRLTQNKSNLILHRTLKLFPNGVWRKCVQRTFFRLVTRPRSPLKNLNEVISEHPVWWVLFATHIDTKRPLSLLQIWSLKSLYTAHISFDKSGPKQKCTQPLATFLAQLFMLFHNSVIHYVTENLEMEVSDWLLQNFNRWESVGWSGW